MKNMKKLMPIILIAAMFLSIYMLVSTRGTEKTEYENLLAEARSCSEDGLVKKSYTAYEAALAKAESEKVRLEIAQMYLKNNLVQQAIKSAEGLIEQYPYYKEGYEFLLELYISQERYEDFFSTYQSATKRKVESEKLTELYVQNAYIYTLGSGELDYVKETSDSMWAYSKKDLWGFVSKGGGSAVAAKYKSCGQFVNSKAAVEEPDGTWYYIDNEGNKTEALPKDLKAEYLGIQNNELVPIKVKGFFGYYSTTGYEYKFGKYDFASTFNSGVAAVKVGKDWSIINTKGDKISKVNYSDVKIDERDIAFTSNGAFVKVNGRYILIDTSCKQIGKNEFEDARMFAGESQYTAVKIKGKWGFIDSTGEIVIDPQYDDALSFSNNLAAVCKDGKWGYINMKNEICIEYTFEDAKSFNDAGITFIKNNDYWSSLSIIRKRYS